MIIKDIENMNTKITFVIILSKIYSGTRLIIEKILNLIIFLKIYIESQKEINLAF